MLRNTRPNLGSQLRLNGGKGLPRVPGTQEVWEYPKVPDWAARIEDGEMVPLKECS